MHIHDINVLFKKIKVRIQHKAYKPPQTCRHVKPLVTVFKENADRPNDMTFPPPK